MSKLSSETRTTATPAAGAAVQATIAAAIEAVEGAATCLRVAEEAALSLAQRERLEGVASDLESTGDTLRWHLNPQARCLLPARAGWRTRLRGRLRPGQCKASTSWSDALAGAVSALEEADARMATLAECISEPMDASLLARSVARRLRAHRDALIEGADRWGLAA